jgi:hypothetical protein
VTGDGYLPQAVPVLGGGGSQVMPGADDAGDMGWQVGVTERTAHGVGAESRLVEQVEHIDAAGKGVPSMHASFDGVSGQVPGQVGVERAVVGDQRQKRNEHLVVSTSDRLLA